MNLLDELKSMLTPQPIPEGAVTVSSLAKASGITIAASAHHLNKKVKEGVLVSRVIRTYVGGRTCDVTIYERPTGTTTAT